MAAARATLRADAADDSSIQKKAIEDAKNAQVSIVDECAKDGKDPPPYALTELIGKGSFGRVYKATGTEPGQLVAVKIISIEEGDSLQPRGADTFGDFMREMNTLKLLNDSGARNINTIIDTLLVGQSVWMVTEYCAGGSVATLMRPTGGLPEKWIVPILREVAEAIRWVHHQGIIHRDIKCANVLVTETGGVQLGNFGVAGIIETKFDKRSTVTGTLQWMAPELFDSSVSYGTEVDIWAFGSMAYEVATGLPPNATSIVDIANFGSYLKRNAPRLQGDRYSPKLKDLVASCMDHDPAQRPRIEEIQSHPYIVNTSAQYPTQSLSKLVSAYRLWEAKGGGRQSLFSAGGARRVANAHSPSASDDWTFDTIDRGQPSAEDADVQDARDAYDPRVGVAPQPSRSRPRRRPIDTKPLTAPLERLFDPNTMTNYQDNAGAFYGRLGPLPASDLPLRDDSESPNVRESLIDLDASLDGNRLSHFVDMETVRPGARSVTGGLAGLDRRQTRDWTFPMMTPASSAPETPSYSDDGNSPSVREWKFPMMTPVSGPQEAISSLVGGQNSPADTHQRHDLPDYVVASNERIDRVSMLSLIDLDAGLPAGLAGVARPPIAGLDGVPINPGLGDSPFDPDRHGLEACTAVPTYREPSIYVPDGIGSVREPSTPVRDDSLDGAPSLHESGDSRRTSQLGATFEGHSPVSPEASPSQELVGHAEPALPVMPPPPSTSAILGTSSPGELKAEVQSMISSLGEHLQYAHGALENRI